MDPRDWWNDPPDIVPLGPNHDTDAFTCGVASMDEFLRTSPRGASPLGTVWVATPFAGSSQVVGYFFVAPDPVELVDELGSVAQGVVMTLRIERLAIATSAQGQKLASYLLAQVFEQVLEAAEVHPIDTVTLVPLTEELRTWYRRLGFRDDPDSAEMILSIRVLREARRKSRVA